MPVDEPALSIPWSTGLVEGTCNDGVRHEGHSKNRTEVMPAVRTSFSSDLHRVHALRSGPHFTACFPMECLSCNMPRAENGAFEVVSGSEVFVRI